MRHQGFALLRRVVLAAVSLLALPAIAAAIDFGDVVVGTSVTGSFQLSFTGVFFVSGVDYPPGFTGDLQAGQAFISGTIKVTFTPTAATAYAGNIVIRGNISGGP